MRSRTLIAAGLVSLLVGGASRAHDPVHLDDAVRYDAGLVDPVRIESNSISYFTNSLDSAQDHLEAFCQYLEEIGVDDTMDIITEHLASGTTNDALEMGMVGFDTDTMVAEITQEANQTLCSYDVRIESRTCAFTRRQNIVNDRMWVIDDHHFRHVTFVSQTDFLKGTDEGKTTPEQNAAYPHLARLPRTPERLYLAAVAEDYEGYKVSILELPAITSCYQVIAFNVNDDGMMDLAVFDPTVYVVKDAERKQPSRVYCANENGYFSNRFCGGKKRELPPHLRIKHRY